MIGLTLPFVSFFDVSSSFLFCPFAFTLNEATTRDRGDHPSLSSLTAAPVINEIDFVASPDCILFNKCHLDSTVLQDATSPRPPHSLLSLLRPLVLHRHTLLLLLHSLVPPPKLYKERSRNRFVLLLYATTNPINIY